VDAVLSPPTPEVGRVADAPHAGAGTEVPTSSDLSFTGGSRTEATSPLAGWTRADRPPGGGRTRQRPEQPV